MKKVRYLVEQPSPNGPRWYWQPSTKLRAKGWRPQRLPVTTREAAEAKAEEINAELDRQLMPIRIAERRANAKAARHVQLQRKSKVALRHFEYAAHSEGVKMFLYVIGTARGLQKVGISRNPEMRRLVLSQQSGLALKLWLLVGGAAIEPAALERSVHGRLKTARREGEWFAVTPAEATAVVLSVLLPQGTDGTDCEQ